jgi:hypothetical protein
LPAAGASGAGAKPPRGRGAQDAPEASVSTARASSFSAEKSSSKEGSTLSGRSTQRA